MPFLYLDLDRTILDHDYTQGTALRTFLGLHGEALRPELAELREAPQVFETQWREVTEHWMDRHFAGEIGYFQQRERRMRHFFGERSKDELLGRYEDYLDAYRGATKVFDDVADFLAALPVRPGLITNGRGSIQRGKLERAGLTEAFAPIVISGEAGVAKPNPRVFALAAEAAGRPPGDCFYVGDKLEHDAMAARAAGYGSAWLRREGREAEPPSREISTVESLSELPALLASA